MGLKTLKDLDVKGKTVLLRSDINSDIVDGRVLKGRRITESLKTIRFLKKSGARIVVLAHQGNPGKKNFYGLYQHARLMRMKFIDDVVGDKAVLAIKKLKNGEAILLDNVRFVKDEFAPKKKKNSLIETFLPLVDIYINDAFSVSHREHSSIVGFSSVKEKGVGLLFEKEIRALEKIKMKNSLFILGGAKAESNIKLLGRGNKVIACGLFGQTCLLAKGFDFGYQNKFLKDAVLIKGGWTTFLRKLKLKLKRVEMPIDFAVLDGKKRTEFSLDEFPRNERIEDIGEKSIEKFVNMIVNADSVYVKGPAGWAEDKRFSKGTDAILRAVLKCKGFTLVGGGQLSEEIFRSRINEKKFNHVSLSGGATLAVVAGEKLVGLKVLGYYSKKISFMN